MTTPAALAIVKMHVRLVIRLALKAGITKLTIRRILDEEVAAARRKENS